jgi:hypothetical protein
MFRLKQRLYELKFRKFSSRKIFGRGGVTTGFDSILVCEDLRTWMKTNCCLLEDVPQLNSRFICEQRISIDFGGLFIFYNSILILGTNTKNNLYLHAQTIQINIEVLKTEVENTYQHLLGFLNKLTINTLLHNLAVKYTLLFQNRLSTKLWQMKILVIFLSHISRYRVWPHANQTNTKSKQKPHINKHTSTL